MFYLKVGKTKNFNSFNYFIGKLNSYLNKKINQINVEVNRIKNYLLRYGLEENEENFHALKKVIRKIECLIYEEILKLIDSCKIIKSESNSLLIEINTENNRKLLDDISKRFFMQRINQQRVEEKICHGYVLGNLFVTYEIYFY